MAVEGTDFVILSAEEPEQKWTAGELLARLRESGDEGEATAERLSVWLGGEMEPASHAPENLGKHLRTLVQEHADDPAGFMKGWLDENILFVLDRSPTQYGGRIELNLLDVSLRTVINIYISVAPDGTCYTGCWDGTDEHECQLASDVCEAIVAARDAGACADAPLVKVEDAEREDDAWYTPEGLSDYVEWAVEQHGAESADGAAEFMKDWLSESVVSVVDWSGGCEGGGIELRTVDENFDGLYLGIAPDGSCVAGGWAGAEVNEIPLSEAASAAIDAAWKAGACEDASRWNPGPVDWEAPEKLARYLEQEVATLDKSFDDDPFQFMLMWLNCYSYDVANLSDDPGDTLIEVKLMGEHAATKLGYCTYLAVRKDGSCATGCRTRGEHAEQREQALSPRVSELVVKAAQTAWPSDESEGWDPWPVLGTSADSDAAEPEEDDGAAGED